MKISECAPIPTRLHFSTAWRLWRYFPVRRLISTFRQQISCDHGMLTCRKKQQSTAIFRSSALHFTLSVSTNAFPLIPSGYYARQWTIIAVTGWTVRGSNLGGGEIFSTHPDNPASCTTGTGSFLGVNRPGHGVDPPPSSVEVKERV